MKLWTMILGLLAVAATVAGCESSTAGSSQTTGSDSSSATGELPSYGAPKVTAPIDNTTKFGQAPCSLLTADQLATVGLVGMGKPGQGAGPLCAWIDSGSSAPKLQFTITRLDAGSQGISSLYKRKSSYGLFEPVAPIQGHPAVLYDESDRRKTGSVGLNVGITDQLAYSVDVDVSDGPDKTQPEKVAQKIADMMITTMKSGK